MVDLLCVCDLSAPLPPRLVQDVFVALYAPWCAHCAELGPMLDGLAAQFGAFLFEF